MQSAATTLAAAPPGSEPGSGKRLPSKLPPRTRSQSVATQGHGGSVKDADEPPVYDPKPQSVDDQ